MDFELQFTDKEITPWGGLSLLKRMLDHIGFDATLAASALPQPQSNRGYRPEQLLVQFMLGVWCGANRFERGEGTRHDTVLQRLFGFARMANFKAVIRLFRKFDQTTNDRVFGQLYAWLFGQLRIDGLTRDLDSTVMTPTGCRRVWPICGCVWATVTRRTMHAPSCKPVWSGWAASASGCCAPTADLVMTLPQRPGAAQAALHRRGTTATAATTGAGGPAGLVDAGRGH